MENKIIKLLEKNKEGLTITELVKELNSTRDKVRISLAKLEGRNLIKIRQIGMAKLILKS